MDVKSLDALANSVPKTPSKAQLGKRRWIGIEVAASVAALDELRERLAPAADLCTHPLRVMQFKPGGSGRSGLAIVGVRLDDYDVLRAQLQQGALTGLGGRTSSGKIRLVRERLGLARPPRPRRR